VNAARLARKWEEAGEDRLAMAEALADEMTAELATKADLAAAVAELRTEIQRMATAFEQAQKSQTKWFAGFILGHYVAVLVSVFALIQWLVPVAS
jgi:hypothetical protein